MVQPEADLVVTARPPHEQKAIEVAPDPEPENIQFISFFESTALKFDRFGCLIVSLTIPPQYIEKGLELRHFTGYPLSVDIQKWRLATENDHG